MPKSIAFFDFDGTVTRKDTLLEFAKFSRGAAVYWIGMCLISPWLIAMKMGVISRQKAKEKFLSYFFSKTDAGDFESQCLAFSKKIIPRLIREDAMQAIQKHRKEDTEVVIVSASAEDWVAPWCIQNNIRYICTRLEIKDNRITGKILGRNCNGPEKVNRIRELFNTADYDTIYCYGDSKEDERMLQLATHPFYREFVK